MHRVSLWVDVQVTAAMDETMHQQWGNNWSSLWSTKSITMSTLVSTIDHLSYSCSCPGSRQSPWTQRLFGNFCCPRSQSSVVKEKQVSRSLFLFSLSFFFPRSVHPSFGPRSPNFTSVCPFQGQVMVKQRTFFEFELSLTALFISLRTTVSRVKTVLLSLSLSLCSLESNKHQIASVVFKFKVSEVGGEEQMSECN